MARRRNSETPSQSATTDAVEQPQSSSDMPWSTSQHDSIPPMELWLNPLETHVYLTAFLHSEGELFASPYDGVRRQIEQVLKERENRFRKGQEPRADLSDPRLRTWKSLFEDYAILKLNDSNVVELTRLGRALRDIVSEVNKTIEGANDHLAKLGIAILNRYTLRNPVDAGEHPADCDIRPFSLMWKAMRRLGNKLHSEEMNRVLMRLNYRRDENAAIDHIAACRRTHSERFDDAHLAALGTPAVVDGDETKRRITPWFTRAGFGGLLIAPDDDERGYRTLIDKHIALIDEAVASDVHVPPDAYLSRDAYFSYLSGDVPTSGPMPGPADSGDVARILDAVDRFGESKIICLSGLPGTGKSRLARIVSRLITDDDDYRCEEVQFHEGTSYDDFMEGFVANPNGNGFELKQKVFRVINRRASLDHQNRKYVLVIEEITRANLHAVLGELMTYIEHRERLFSLTLSQSKMAVSRNLVVLATMNPRDRSAMVLDHALMRRLHVVDVPSSPERLTSMLTGKLDEALLSQLAGWFGTHWATLPFGHGVFANADSAAALRQLWQGTLRHFLTDVGGEIKPQYQTAVDQYPWK